MAESSDVDQSTSAQRAQHHSPPSVCVVGVGTVGLHEALAFEEAGHDTAGYDIDVERIRACRRGEDSTGAVDEDRLARSECLFTMDPTCIEAAEYVIVAIPTATDDGTPTMESVAAAAETVGHHIVPETTVVLVSTVYPGATEQVFVPTLEAASGLAADTDFSVAHAPVRLSPRTDGSTVIPETRLVGADSAAVADEVAELFERVVDTVHVVDTIRATEAAKCVENVQRDVNIALVNELAHLLGEMNIDTRAVLDAAGTKWNFQQYEPGLVGGECVPIAPQFIMERARRAGATPRLLEHARAVNDRMVDRVTETTVSALAHRADRRHGTEPTTPTDPATVLLLGLSYKPDSSSLEATPAKSVARRLERRGVRVVGHDPLVDADAAADALDIDVLPSMEGAKADAVAILVDHSAFASLTIDDIRKGTSPVPVVVDLPGVFDPDSDHATVIYRDVSDVS
ncbi:nucleotide sugar dehydrogenase [Halorubrum sp. AD140]|uniref:nucleotide sugar dehydrogenase n=1 Tax=Halorubrum sp. AD140 TaxID=3050073 RepID=UPI002ACCF3A5|nr:nucleotide sugar dehydrogenase [Halorubrum sp. AD140]MDZ5812519.1 nucleotide sugar dehydrogenase [Halorubrum sp. AD140]